MMKIYCKALAVFLGLALSFSVCALLSGCSGSGDTADKKQTSKAGGKPSTEDEAHDGLASLGIYPDSLGITPEVKHDEQNKAGFQLDMPQKGDTVAVIHTSEGDIRLRLFSDQAPKAVTNFINLAKSGSYSNTSFHRVFAGSFIQGGHCGKDEKSPNGVSSFGGQFEDEFCDSLLNLRGAVSMVNNAQDSNGSQFLINQTTAETFAKKGGWSTYEKLWSDTKTQLVNYKDTNLLSAYVEENGNHFINTDIIPGNVRELYLKNGGNPDFDGVYNAADRGNTVFAQVYDGMTVVDKICSCQVDKENTPVDRISIKSVEITTYK